MSDAANPKSQGGGDSHDGGFSRLRVAARKRGPLSFGDLSASLAKAQKDTGFVDTVSVDAPATVNKDAPTAKSVKPPDASPRDDQSRSAREPTINTTAAQAMPAVPAPPAIDSGIPQRRRGRVRADIVQCNLKLPEAVRDALHLQALRERRTIADLVTEVMSGYLTAKGTFDRLR